jgi:hypothetical protein
MALVDDEGVMAVVLRRARAAAISPCQAQFLGALERWRRRLDVLGQRLCRRERVESGGPHVYVRKAKLSGLGGSRGCLAELGGFKGIQVLTRRVVCPSVLGIWIWMEK